MTKSRITIETALLVALHQHEKINEMSIIKPTVLKKTLFALALVITLAACVLNKTDSASKQKPNIILIMADDLGWGDVGFNGNQIIKTPNLDKMAQEGLQFDRFYSAAPVCSPTRGSCLTGKHPFRYGIYFAMTGHIKKEEVLIPEILRKHGYTTGHFGKWHLGTLTHGEQKRWGGWTKDPEGNYSPPWENGYDTCFVTESKVPTWNPMIVPEGWPNMEAGPPFGNDYWTGYEKKARENLDGDDSRVIVDRVTPFIENSVKTEKPFFSVIWFHTPHEPVVAGSKYKSMYTDYSEEEQHYYGCITAMDEQVGRLNDKLKELGVDNNTIIWFCSDNDPEVARKGKIQIGSAAPFRGLKRSLHEEGIRVPAICCMARIPKRQFHALRPIISRLMDLLGLHRSEYENPLDGISLLPVTRGERTKRDMPIGFKSQNQRAWNTDEYKLYSGDGGKTFALYDLLSDPHEDHDLSNQFPEMVAKMKAQLLAWEESCNKSDKGLDYQTK